MKVTKLSATHAKLFYYLIKKILIIVCKSLTLAVGNIRALYEHAIALH